MITFLFVVVYDIYHIQTEPFYHQYYIDKNHLELDDFYQYNIDEIKGFCLNMIYIFMQTTTNRNVINNYNRIYQHLLKSSVDIVEIIELEGQEEVACVKTFWLKCFQRRYKKYYKKNRKSLEKERIRNYY